MLSDPETYNLQVIRSNQFIFLNVLSSDPYKLNNSDHYDTILD